jgi:hypothetical protein
LNTKSFQPLKNSTNLTHLLFLELSEFQYQTAWRSCKWELETKEAQLLEGREGFHMSAFICLRALHEGNESVFASTLKQARLDVVKSIGQISTESAKSVYPALVKLQFFSELENAWKLRWRSSQKFDVTNAQAQLLMDQWKVKCENTVSCGVLFGIRLLLSLK